MESNENHISNTEENHKSIIPVKELPKNDRGTWDSQWEFFLSCLGYAVGFGNVWRFPYLCYKNGGAAFLIPYFVMLFIAGLPLFFMEFVLGQYTSLGVNILFRNLAPVAVGVGYGMLVICALVCIYYNVIFAWTLFYTFASFTSVLPWGNCNNEFNSLNCYTQEASLYCQNQSLIYYNQECVDSNIFCEAAQMDVFNSSHCLQLRHNDTDVIPHESAIPRISAAEDYFRNRMLGVTDRTWEDMGGMRWELVGCLALAWLIIAACMIKGVKSSGKVVYVTATFPYLVLVILFFRGITLEGAYKGIEFYLLRPNMTRLADIEVWNDAATQIFFSLGSSLGVLITLSSYNKFTNNCMRDAITVAICNCATSVFAGFVIFSILGFMANQLNVEVKDVVSSGSGLAFIAYPEAVTKMPISPLWSILFFVMLITLGIDSQFSFTETVATAIFDKYPNLRSKKPQVMFILAFVLFLAGLTMCLEGGSYMFELFVWYSSGISLIAVGICEVLAVQYIYGYKRIMSNIKEMGITMPGYLRVYWTVTWLFLTPASLLVILVLSIYQAVPAYLGSYVFPSNIQALGWIMCSASIICIPIGAIWAYYKNTTMNVNIFSPTPKMCPAHMRNLLMKQEEAKAAFKYTHSYTNEGFTQ